MKLSKYIAIVKSEAYCRIITQEDSNIMWFGLNEAIYYAENMPHITGEYQAAAVMGLTEKQKDKIFFDSRYAKDITNICGFDLSDGVTASEQPARQLRTAVAFNDEMYSVLQCNDGELIFYNPFYLAPLQDVMRDSEYFELAVRKTENGQRYIVAKDGMNVLACILPLKIDFEQYLSKLAEFESLCAGQYERERNRKPDGSD